MTKQKIVFLDIDGVLNRNSVPHVDHFEVLAASKMIKNIRRCEIKHLLGFLDPELIALFNRLISVTKAKIVISSSWRKHVDINNIKTLLKVRGANFFILDKTVHTMNLSERKDEIEHWLDRNQEIVDKFVIVDDTPISATPSRLDNNFVLVDPTTGFSEKDLVECQRILLSAD